VDKDLARKRIRDEFGLTQREGQMLAMLADGKNQSEAAIALGISRMRASQLKRQLMEKGMITPTGLISKKGKEALGWRENGVQ